MGGFIVLAMLAIANGADVWMAIVAAVAAFGFGFERFFMAAQGAASRAREVTRLSAMSLGALAICATLIEVYLELRGGALEDAPKEGQYFMLPPDVVTRAFARTQPPTLPASWRHRRVEVEGASEAYYWHDALHLKDTAGFRRLIGDFPTKNAEAYRILIVGDSLTYGLGVPEVWTYGRILERALDRDYRVEVLNLGVSGFQSEDVLHLVTRYVPRLKPDLVVYGVCLNDFLPSRTNEYRAFTFPCRMRSRISLFSARGWPACLTTATKKLSWPPAYKGIFLTIFSTVQPLFARASPAMWPR